MTWNYTEDEIKEALKFVLNDNPDKIWKSEKELLDAVNNHLVETTVISNLEELIKDGMIKEISPNRFVPTEKGLKIAKEMEKEKEKEKKE